MNTEKEENNTADTIQIKFSASISNYLFQNFKEEGLASIKFQNNNNTNSTTPQYFGIVLIGNCEALGNWILEKGQILQQQNEFSEKIEFSSSLISIPKNFLSSNLEFKFVLVSSTVPLSSDHFQLFDIQFVQTLDQTYQHHLSDPSTSLQKNDNFKILSHHWNQESVSLDNFKIQTVLDSQDSSKKIYSVDMGLLFSNLSSLSSSFSTSSSTSSNNNINSTNDSSSMFTKSYHLGSTIKKLILTISNGAISLLDSSSSMENFTLNFSAAKQYHLQNQSFTISSKPIDVQSHNETLPEIVSVIHQNLQHLIINVSIHHHSSLLGYCNIVANTFCDLRKGKNKLPITLNDSCIGFLEFDFLLVTPFSHPKNNFEHIWRRNSKNETTLVGHRGCGKSFGNTVMKNGQRKSVVAENTIVSFNLASKYGAQFVEFDIQITNDLVPVIYHDYEVNLQDSHSRRVKTPISTMHSKDFLRITPDWSAKEQARKIKNNCKYDKLSNDRIVLPKLKRSNSLPDLLSFPVKCKERITIHDKFTTLKEILHQLPNDLGFLVELKYPSIRDQLQRGIVMPERNIYVDSVLQVIFDHNVHDRNIVIISFDPDICLLLSLKQQKYPVFFLTAAGKKEFFLDTDSDIDVNDPRTSNLYRSIRFASQSRLNGIITHTEPVIRDPSFIKYLKQHNLMMFTYGDDNEFIDKVNFQRENGVDGVIVDNIIRRKYKLAELDDEEREGSQS